MKLIPFEKLYNTEFLISEPIAKRQYWFQRGNTYNAMGKPKISHTLLWFQNCSAVITDISGKVLTVKQNQLTYMAKGSEYRVDFFDTDPSRADTIVIHFQMTDLNGEDIIPTTMPMICMKDVDLSFSMLINSMADEFKNNIVCVPELKSSIYKLLSAICQKRKKRAIKNKYTCIYTGIKLLEQNNDMKIGDIAEICGVSECYFRKLFKEYSGESPMDFRQHYRIEKAKQLLLSDEGLSVSEIAEELNFSDIYHFSKTFKKLTNMSPTQFLNGGTEQSNQMLN
ncbi:MAG: helix-turn-helix transcriptional regulator [Clostridia bacterium]|nr:helix-turn-helix transcriptional regulator [Clostridia bacterium]